MLRKRRFPFNKRDCIISNLMSGFSSNRWYPIHQDAKYILPQRRDIIVEGFYYAGVSEYITLQEINHYKKNIMMFHFECHRANGGVYAGRYYINFDKRDYFVTNREASDDWVTLPIRNLIRTLVVNGEQVSCDEFIRKTLTDTGILFSQGIINHLIECTTYEWT